VEGPVAILLDGPAGDGAWAGAAAEGEEAMAAADGTGAGETFLGAAVTLFQIADDSPPLPGALAPGESASVKIRPLEGLGPGVYTGTLVVLGANGARAEAGLSFTVTP